LGAESLAVEATMSKDSRLVIKTSTLPASSGAVEMWKRSAATKLGLRPSAVTLEALETDKVPDTGPATLSRTVSIVTRLVESACEGLRTKRFREALPITVRKTQRASSKDESLESSTEPSSWAGAVVEVSLAAVGDAPSIRGIWIVAKAGRLLSPSEAKRTLERDAVISIGMCLGERLELSDGPASFDDVRRYQLPRLMDAPPVHVEFLDDDSEPLGIGELAYTLVPPAFANALSQALDARQDALPLGFRANNRGVIE
jgi:CO/xanthine dehydrogenase Mo-binding subunit